MPKRLEKLAQLDALTIASAERPQMIFKHSTRCSISAAAKHRLESDLQRLKQYADVYFLDLLMHRDISNEIAKRFVVHHESPQILVINHGQSIFDLSHYDIEPEAIVRQFVASAL